MPILSKPREYKLSVEGDPCTRDKTRSVGAGFFRTQHDTCIFVYRAVPQDDLFRTTFPRIRGKRIAYPKIQGSCHFTATANLDAIARRFGLDNVFLGLII